jgi:hypothetical protein
VVSILPAGLPHGITAVLGWKPIWQKMVFFGVNHFGHRRSLKLIKPLPNGSQPVSFEISHDKGGEVALPWTAVFVWSARLTF